MNSMKKLHRVMVIRHSFKNYNKSFTIYYFSFRSEFPITLCGVLYTFICLNTFYLFAVYDLAQMIND